MLEPKIHSGHIEVAVAHLIGYRANVIVPNLFWGLGLKHEADLIVMDSGDRLTEIEIKISLQDLKADFKKEHAHKSKLISRLVYAVPKNLVENALNLVPKEHGLRPSLSRHLSASVKCHVERV